MNHRHSNPHPGVPAIRTIHFVSMLFGVSSFLGLVAAMGCSATSSRAPAAVERGVSAPSRALVRAKPRDISAAVSRAITELSLAPLRVQTPGPGQIEYELISSNDEPGWLRIRFDASADDPPSAARRARDISLEASIGRFGDPARQRRFLDSISRNLRTLAKDD